MSATESGYINFLFIYFIEQFQTDVPFTQLYIQYTYVQCTYISKFQT